MLFIKYILTIVSNMVFIFSISTAQEVPPQELPIIHQMVRDVSADRIENDIRKLVSFGTRHTLSDTKSQTQGIGAARRWIFSEFEKVSASCGGCLDVMYVSDIVTGNRIPEPTEVVSVIAIQRGEHDPNRYVSMSGDIDSRISDPLNGNDKSPGANDNASGMAGVIEAARILSKYKFAGSIIYMGLSGEEQGLYGGRIVAAHALKNKWRIKAVLNNDMIGNITGINGVVNNTSARVFSEGTRYVETEDEARQRRFSGGEVDSPSRNIARFIDRQADKYVPNLDVMMIYRLDRFGRGGHHRPFNAVGIPAVRIMETNEHYDRQHQDIRVENGREYGDVIEGVNFDYTKKLTALNISVLAEMASAPPFPSNVTLKGAVRASAVINWTKPKGKMAQNLSGYKVYWRLTDSNQWTYSKYIGDVDTYTFNNLVIDNYYFGVSSISKNGAESPVVFPGPMGSFGEY
ncbi:M28 family metallopeptidase [Emcibacteraceae bacterium]|nr:M28 family metallopeptidase [Emcibacteraceae bacterium]